MKRYQSIAVLFTVFLSLTSYAGSDTQDAELAAREWLEAVDKGNIFDTWSSSSALLQEATTSGALAGAIEAARRGFGAVITRERVSARRESSLPGAPDGEYIVLTFQTRFENKERGIETVTPRLEEGVWKVSGYYVK